MKEAFWYAVLRVMVKPLPKWVIFLLLPAIGLLYLIGLVFKNT